MTPKVPQYLLNCANVPNIPSIDARMPEINLFIIDLHAAHADCYKKLGLTAGILESFQAQIEARGNDDVSQ